jgi:DNA-binding NtrC family response regulator
MRALVAALQRYAHAEANLLITGETGSGKDLVARALHGLGARHRAPFVVVDCPGLPATLFEAELFGYERGAFTDATLARPGRFEQAGDGTVYLDRVDELPLDAQAKLLRLVERKQVERLGSSVPVPVRARVVASATSDMEQAVRAGRFRMDLYHRLRVLPLHVPPLRERQRDLPTLVRRLLADLTSETGRRPPAVDPGALELLAAYDWPGNVRELAHVLERALVATGAAVISAADLPDDLVSVEPVIAGRTTARPTLEELERQYITMVLRETRGNQTRAAAVLGISRKALWEKRKRYALDPGRAARGPTR